MEHLALHYLMGLIVFLEVRAYLERKALLNRLMARDLTELTESEKKVKIKEKEPLRIEL
jgi:hypothetical protein